MAVKDFMRVLYTGPRTFEEMQARLKSLFDIHGVQNPVFVNNGTTEVVHGNNFPQIVEGPTEITAGEEATYTITEFDIRKEETLSTDKGFMKWAFYIDGVEIVNNLVNYLRILNTRRKPESPTDFMAIEDVQARTQAMMDHAILYAKIASAEEGQRTYRTKLTVRFSKWLDGHQVHIEAYRSDPDLKPKNAWVATTEVKAEPEILQGYWANDRREKITGRTVGYKDTVYMCLQTLGMQGQQLRAELWEEGVSFRGIINSFDEELLQDNHITFAIEERLSYQKLELPDEDSEEFKKQRAAVMESGDLDLYFTLPDASDIKGHEKKYGRLLYLATEEKLSVAYFAQAVKKEAIKDRRVSEETPEPIHQVKSGETLSKIAPKYGIGWKTLATHNNIQSPYTIRIGQELKLPEDATIPEGTATFTASEQGNKKTTTAYERIDSGTLGSEVYLVVETANLRGKKVDIEIFDQEKLLAEDDETAIEVIRDDQETDWINAVKIDDTGKAIVKVKLRKKNDEDYKKQQEALKDDKQARLFLKVTCQGDDRKHKKVFLKPIEEDQYIHPIAFGEYFKLMLEEKSPVTKVEGPFDKTGNLLEEVERGSKYTYHAVLDKDPDELELDKINWAVSYDDEEAEKAYKLPFTGGKRISDRKISVDIEIEKGEEKFRIYAYQGDMPDEDVSLDIMYYFAAKRELCVYEAAVLSDAVYYVNNGNTLEHDLIEFIEEKTGFNLSKKKINGISINEFDNTETGFRSALFERTNKNGSTEYVYATAGTGDFPDAVTDVKQFLGLLEPQYPQSTNNAVDIVRELGVENVTFVGHSLGGGLAAANALATGGKAITFNAAALNPKTKSRHGLIKSAEIDNFFILGEIVTEAQGTIGIGNETNGLVAEGNQHPLLPPEGFELDLTGIGSPLFDNRSPIVKALESIGKNFERAINTPERANNSIQNHLMPNIFSALDQNRIK